MQAETGWIKQHSAGSEAAALAAAKQRGEKAVDLNQYGRYTTAKNFPLLDNASDRTFQSVKVKGVPPPNSSADKPLRPDGPQKYVREYEKLLDQNLTANAAKEIAKYRSEIQEAGAWPKDLPKDASPSDIAHFVRERAELAVPDDHVSAVREAIGADARQLPQNYGLDRNSPTFDADVARLQERVVPAGVTVQQLKQIQDEIHGAAR
jgi:hypothetical protein